MRLVVGTRGRAARQERRDVATEADHAVVAVVTVAPAGAAVLRGALGSPIRRSAVRLRAIGAGARSPVTAAIALLPFAGWAFARGAILLLGGLAGGRRGGDRGGGFGWGPGLAAATAARAAAAFR